MLTDNQLDDKDRKTRGGLGVIRQSSDVIFMGQADIDSVIINLISNTEKVWRKDAGSESRTINIKLIDGSQASSVT